MEPYIEFTVNLQNNGFGLAKAVEMFSRPSHPQTCDLQCDQISMRDT